MLLVTADAGDDGWCVDSIVLKRSQVGNGCGAGAGDAAQERAGSGVVLLSSVARFGERRGVTRLRLFCHVMVAQVGMVGSRSGL